MACIHLSSSLFISTMGETLVLGLPRVAVNLLVVTGEDETNRRQ